MADPFTAIVATGLVLETAAAALECAAAAGEVIRFFTEEPGLSRDEFYRELRDHHKHNQEFIARATTLTLEQISRSEERIVEHITQALNERDIRHAMHEVVVSIKSIHDVVGEASEVNPFIEQSLIGGLTSLRHSLNRARLIVEPAYWEGWQQCAITGTTTMIAAYEFLGQDASTHREELAGIIRQVKVRTLNTIATNFDFQAGSFPWGDVPQFLLPSGNVQTILALGRPDNPGQPFRTTQFTNSIGMEFVLIPAGSFIMGSPDAVTDAGGHEKPLHRVEISEPLYLGKYPVTQREWQAVIGRNPSTFKGDARPVENVSWRDAQEFILKLNEKEGVTQYRLPTEAEWEYACRAGTSTPRYHENIDAIAWHLGNSNQQTYPVGEKKPNAWGLYDMLGNVFEWVEDWYAEDYYARSPDRDPQGPDAGTVRVIRGGGWDYDARFARSAHRSWDAPGFRDHALGFRCSSSANVS